MEKTGKQLLSRAKAIEIVRSRRNNKRNCSLVFTTHQLHPSKSSKLLLLRCPTNKNIRH